MPAIIVIGASRDQVKYGNRAVRAYKDAGYQVFPVNPAAEKIEGLKAYAKMEDLPAKLSQLATIYTPPEVTAKLLPALAKYGVKQAYFNPGAETDALVEQARSLGIQPILACSITAIGRSPADYAP